MFRCLCKQFSGILVFGWLVTDLGMIEIREWIVELRIDAEFIMQSIINHRKQFSCMYGIDLVWE